MARRESFSLDLSGGAIILQKMTRKTVHAQAQKIAAAATKISGGDVSLIVRGAIEPLKGGKSDSYRYTALLVPRDTKTSFVLRRSKAVDSAVESGRL